MMRELSKVQKVVSQLYIHMWMSNRGILGWEKVGVVNVFDSEQPLEGAKWKSNFQTVAAVL